jgi:hypothetical protein
MIDGEHEMSKLARTNVGRFTSISGLPMYRNKNGM